VWTRNLYPFHSEKPPFLNFTLRSRPFKPHLTILFHKNPFWRILILLRREGWRDNHKRVHRLYMEKGLNLRNKRTRPNKSAAHRLGRNPCSCIHQCWSNDLVADQLFDHHHHHRVPAPARRGAALRLRLLRGEAGAVRFHGAGLAAGRQAGVGVFQQHHVRECGAGLEEAAGDGGALVRGGGDPLGNVVLIVIGYFKLSLKFSPSSSLSLIRPLICHGSELVC
jgi:hypothetical protein